MKYSFEMKPIWKILAIISLASNIRCQKYQQEQYPFPPHFQTPNTPIFSSDSTIYLPPESSTPMPYFPANNMNKYSVKYLPPTAAKAPSIYPTPYPSVSSSSRPDFEEELKNFREISKLRTPLAHQAAQVDKNLNNTNNNMGQQTERREMKTIHRLPIFQEKIDNLKHFENMEQKKPQFPATLMQTQNTLNQNPATRRMIVTSEILRNENAMDQVKAASYANSQYIQAPGVIIASTEPAIPILRLSNEMDLDGSFSYEALGADQTHYVQHSRMENMGTDKEEQVVEGSYSYVGDNGQTYTVHYVADSNGYRASGDHLPVAPPIPEIIQRAVQYNLAEEARRPPNLKQPWETESKDYENDETSNRYTITSLRNLFTGRTPEAFSLGFTQGSNPQNNLIPSASSNVPVKASYEIIGDQNKPKSNTPIAPQVTFLATQGAHNPSSQQVASRIVSTERPTMPQIVNYEATVKEADPEANKGLWRWQYGLNTNDNSNPSKNTISRSSGEKDDVIINFNNMTPEQYTKMLHAEISGQQATADSSVFLDNSDIHNIYNTANTNYPPSNEVVVIKANNNEQTEPRNNFLKTEYISTTTSTETFAPSTTVSNSNENADTYKTKNIDELDQTNIYANIISSQNFVPKSSIVTQTYDIEDVTNDIYVDISKQSSTTEKNSIEEEKVVKSETKYPYFVSKWVNNNYDGSISTNIPVSSTPEINLKFAEIVTNKNDFKPVTVFDKYYETTTKPNLVDSASDEESLKENIFLRNLLKPKTSEYENVNKIYNTPLKETDIYDSYQVEPKEEKAPKILQYQPSPQNEIKFTQKKPFDINDVLNYVTLKNHFESSKMKPKNTGSVNLSQSNNHKEIRPLRYIPNLESTKNQDVEEDSDDSYQVRNNPQKELHGVIKNYKILQRQRNNNHANNHFPELTHRNIKTFHNLGLPPLGRAGPSLKSYLPPTFV